MAEKEDGLTAARMAAATGVSVHTLRYYERVDLIRPVARNAGNQRRYSADDVAWLRFLLRLRATGMPIAQMRSYALLRARGPVTTESRLRMLEAHQADLDEQIAGLRAHQQALAEKIATYRQDLRTREAAQKKGPDDD